MDSPSIERVMQLIRGMEPNHLVYDSKRVSVFFHVCARMWLRHIVRHSDKVRVVDFVLYAAVSVMHGVRQCMNNFRCRSSCSRSAFLCLCV